MPAKRKALPRSNVSSMSSRSHFWRSRHRSGDGSRRRIARWINSMSTFKPRMGWTNSHLHQFEIDGERYGDPGAARRRLGG